MTARVVVVGAGFGGLTAARALARLPVRVTLVDRRNYHTFQPLLYQVATAGLDSASIAYPIRSILHSEPSLRVRVGAATGVDLDGRRVELEDGGLEYDYLVLAAGAITANFGIPGVEEHGLPLKSLTDALRLRSHLLEQFEHSDASRAERDRDINIVVVGGGPTGVELCGGLSELITGVLCGDYPDLDLSRARIILVEAAGRLLGAFSASSSRRALEDLSRRGVEVRLGATVRRVGPDWVELGDGSALPTRTLVWTAGIRANPLGERLGVELTRGGRVPVGADLSLPGRPEVFVIGDLAAARDSDGRTYPQLAPVAMQQARHVARQIAGRLEGRAGVPFRYRDKGTMATIGRNSAVAELPGHIRFGGFPAWIAWLGLHLVFLVGFRNRLAVLLDWSWNYLTYQRGARLILPVDSDDEPGGTSAGASDGSA